MPFSVWEYLRDRTRDAVLAGFQDALDIAEQGDTDGSQHAAARQLTTRLGMPEAQPVPSASMNGRNANGEETTTQSRIELTEAPSRLAPVARAAALARPAAVVRPAEPAAFDDELENRLDAAGPQPSHGPQNDWQTSPRALPPSQPPRRRGRPRKDEGR